MIDIRIDGKVVSCISGSNGWAICTFVIPPGKSSILALELRCVKESSALEEIARISGKVSHLVQGFNKFAQHSLPALAVQGAIYRLPPAPVG